MEQRIVSFALANAIWTTGGAHQTSRSLPVVVQLRYEPVSCVCYGNTQFTVHGFIIAVSVHTFLS